MYSIKTRVSELVVLVTDEEGLEEFQEFKRGEKDNPSWARRNTGIFLLADISANE